MTLFNLRPMFSNKRQVGPCSILLCSAVLFLSPLFTHAQQIQKELENVVLTASQYPEQADRTGRNIIVFKGDWLRKLPATSLDEWLRFLPGIEVQQRGIRGAQADLIIRGSTFQQALVLIDGVKINDPLTGHFNLYIPLHPESIERIEILKGAAAAIWGSEAVGGVVHFITRQYAGTNTTSVTKAGVSAGRFGSWQADAYLNRAIGKGTWTAAMTSSNADGQALRGTTGFFHLHSLQLSYQQLLGKKIELRWRGAGDLRSFNAQNYYTTFKSDTANEKVNSWWQQVGIKSATRKGTLHADLFQKSLFDRYWFRPAAIPNQNRTALWVAQTYYHYRIDKALLLTAGTQWQYKQIRSNDRGNHSLAHGAVYAILRHEASKQLQWQESLRLDWDQQYGWVLVPQVNASYHLSDITFRASGGRSFRDADFTERYNNYNKALVTAGRIGNPALRPEDAWNAEVGMDWNPKKNWWVRSSFFYRKHRGLIDWVLTPYASMPRKDNLVSNGSYLLASNIAAVTTTGAEWDLQLRQPLRNNQAINASLGITTLHSQQASNAPALYSTAHARWLVNSSFVYVHPKGSLAITLLYKKRQSAASPALLANISKDYFVANASISKTFKQNNKAFLQLDNLLNTVYSDLLGARMPGRWLSGGIQITLQP